MRFRCWPPRNQGFMLIELVAALAITSIICASLLLALVTFEEAETTQEVEVGVLAQLRYQTTLIRGLPLPLLKSLFSSGAILSRTGPNDLRLYGIFNPPSRQATVNWELKQVDNNGDTGEALLGVTVTVSASVVTGGGTIITRSSTVYRALE